MKGQIFLVAVLVTLVVAENYDISKRFLKCDDILSVKVCDKFRKVGDTINLKASEVETFVKDAYNKGITKIEDVRNYVEQKLEEKIFSKSCEELTGKTFCEKLDAISSHLKKKKDEYKPYVVKAIMDGKNKIIDITTSVENYIKNDLMMKSCADILTSDQCKKIENVGAALKLKTNEIKEAVMEGFLKGYQKVSKTMEETFTSMKKAAEKFQCEDLLNGNICKNLRGYAQSIRIGMPKMMNAVRSAIVMGYRVSSGTVNVIYKIADAFIDCEDFISHDKCEKIKATASKIGAKTIEITNAIKDAVTKGIKEAEKIYKNTLSFLKNKFGKKKRSLMSKADFLAKLEIYKQMFKKHMAKADEFVKKMVSEMLEKYKQVDEAIKNAVVEAIRQGKLKYEQIKDYIKELVNKKTDGKIISKRDTAQNLREKLRSVLNKVGAATKLLIKTFLDYPMEKFQKYKRKIQAFVDALIGTPSKRDLQEDLMEDMSELSEDLSNEIDQLTEDVVDGTATLIHDLTKEKRQKRLIDVDLKDLKLPDFVTETLKRELGKVYEKIASKSSDLMKQVTEALKKAGENMKNFSKIVLEKIEEIKKKVKSEGQF